MASNIPTPDIIADKHWTLFGAKLAAIIGADLFQYALELDNNGPVWLDSVWLLTDIVINKRN